MTTTILIVLAICFAALGIRIVQQYQRGLVFRLGRYESTRGPGLTGSFPSSTACIASTSAS